MNDTFELYDPKALVLFQLQGLMKDEDISDQEVLEIINKHRPQIVTAIKSEREPSIY